MKEASVKDWTNKRQMSPWIQTWLFSYMSLFSPFLLKHIWVRESWLKASSFIQCSGILFILFCLISSSAFHSSRFPSNCLFKSLASILYWSHPLVTSSCISHFQGIQENHSSREGSLTKYMKGLATIHFLMTAFLPANNEKQTEGQMSLSSPGQHWNTGQVTLPHEIPTLTPVLWINFLHKKQKHPLLSAVLRVAE